MGSELIFEALCAANNGGWALGGENFKRQSAKMTHLAPALRSAAQKPRRQTQLNLL